MSDSWTDALTPPSGAGRDVLVYLPDYPDLCSADWMVVSPPEIRGRVWVLTHYDILPPGYPDHPDDWTAWTERLERIEQLLEVCSVSTEVEETLRQAIASARQEASGVGRGTTDTEEPF